MNNIIVEIRKSVALDLRFGEKNNSKFMYINVNIFALLVYNTMKWRCFGCGQNHGG